MNINKINEIINLKDKQTNLFKELKQSLIYEQCTHEVVKIPLSRTEYIFVIYDIKSRGQVYESKSENNVDEWLKRRSIDRVYRR